MMTKKRFRAIGHATLSISRAALFFPPWKCLLNVTPGSCVPILVHNRVFHEFNGIYLQLHYTEYIFKSAIFREIDFRVRHKSINSEIITGILIIALSYSWRWRIEKQIREKEFNK